MKKIVIITIAVLLGILLVALTASGEEVIPGTIIVIGGRTILTDGSLAIPDSLQILVYFQGSNIYSRWVDPTNDASACFVDNGGLWFHDLFGNIDGGGSTGHYLINVRAFDHTNTVYTDYYYSFSMYVPGRIDWDNMSNPTATVNLTNTTIGTVTGLTNNVTVGTNNDKAGYSLADASITSAKFASGAIDAAAIGSDAVGASELATDAVTEIENAIYVNRADYMADVSTLALDANVDSALVILYNMAYFRGAVDNCLYLAYPQNSRPKDSIVFFYPSIAEENRKAKITYTRSVSDTTVLNQGYFEVF